MAPGLAALDNVVLVPHLGSATTWTREGMATLAAANVAAILKGWPVWPRPPASRTSRRSSDDDEPPHAAPSIVNADELGLPRLARAGSDQGGPAVTVSPLPIAERIAASAPRRPSPSPPRPPPGKPKATPSTPSTSATWTCPRRRTSSRPPSGRCATARPATAPTPASRPLREALAADVGASHGLELGPQNVAIQPGGKPVIGKFILALMNPGDEVLYPNPGYPIYESQIEFHGGVALPYGYVEGRRELRARLRGSGGPGEPAHAHPHLQQPAEPHRRREQPGGARAGRRVRPRPRPRRALRRGLLGHPLLGAAASRWPRCPAWPSAASSSTPSARSSP